MTRKIYKMNVVGFDHYQPALASLMTEPNEDYNMTKSEMIDELDLEEPVYQYETAVCELQIRHEPNNPYDPAALQVFADGILVGYVPKGNLTALSRISRLPGLQMHVEIYGGRYRYLEHDDEADPFLEFQPKHFKIRTENSPYKAIMVFAYQG